MTIHTFTLILTGPVDDRLDQLFEAGLDDALFGEVDGVHYAEIDRESATLADAILSAITNIETVPDIQTVRVEPDDLVTAAEIAQRLGRTRESVRLLISGKRGTGRFPAPISHTRSRTRLWRWTDVSAWAHDTDDPDAQTVAAINAALEFRTHTTVLPLDRRRDLEHLATMAEG